MDLITDYQARSRGRWLKPGQWMRDARRAARDYDRLLRFLPRALADILDRFRAGTLEVRHEHHHLQESVHRLVKGLLAASLLLSAALLLGRGDETPWRTALGLSCFVLAAYLGFRLLRSITAAEREGRE
jgi:ubiquinone biosynthesis protein